MKKLMIRIGWNQEYIIEADDAIRLLEIASRAVQVTRTGYSGPYFPVDEPEPFISSAEMVDFEPPELTKEADSGVHLRAARDFSR